MEQKREVNANSEVEVINVPDEETTDDEIIVPAVDESELDKPTESPESSTDEKAPESKEDEAKVIPEKEEPLKKPVEGETPREHALRKEIEKLRGEKREALTKKVFDNVKSGPVISERLTKLKEAYSPEEFKNIEEAVDAIAESRGYQKKEQTYQDMANDVLENFISDHPEYKPVNDKDDIRWGRFHEVLTSGIYNLGGKSAKQLKSIYERVNSDVMNDLGEPLKDEADKKIAAARQKIKSVSHSSGTKQQTPKEKTQLDPSIRSVFKGFDDEDLM